MEDIRIVRKKTQRIKPSTSLRETLRSYSVPQPIARQPEDISHYCCRTKVCTSFSMAHKSVNYDKSTDELLTELAVSFGLTPD